MPTYRQQQAELAERFLKAIEEERERERAEDYREQLKDLWSRYQKDEDNIEQELFNENGNDVETDYATNLDDPSRKKKRQVCNDFKHYSAEITSIKIHSHETK